jgi:hypothetical protein
MIFQTFYEFKYILIYSVIIFLTAILTSSYDVESATSVLNGIIQGLSSILAIVISLTLIGVQLSSQNYSNRILKMFVGFRYFRVLMVLYLSTIIYSIFLLNNLDSIDIFGTISSWSVIGVSISILFAVWSLILLPKYIIDTLDQLAPENVLRELYEKIDAESIKDIEKLSNECLMPLTEIINKSTENGHTDIASLGITKMSDKFSELINEENGESLLKYYLNQMERIGEVAISNSNSKILELVIDNVSDIELKVFRPGLDLRNISIKFYGQLSKKMVDSEFESAIDKLMGFFEEKFIPYLIRKASNRNDFWGTAYIIALMKHSNNMFKSASEKRQSQLRSILGFKLDYLIKKIARSGFFGPINSELDFLKDFGIWSIKHDPTALFQVVDSLFTILEGLLRERVKGDSDDEIKDKTKKLINKLIESLYSIGLAVINEGLYDFRGDFISPLYANPIIFTVTSYLQYTANYIYKRRLFIDENEIIPILSKIILYLREMGLELIDKKPSYSINVILNINSLGIPNVVEEGIISEILESIKEIEIKLIENEFKENLSIGMEFIANIAMYSLENEFNETISNSSSYLKEIALNLTCKIDFKLDLSNLIEYIEEICNNAIFEKNPEINVLIYASILREILKKLKEECSEDFNMQKALDSLDKLRKKLIEENKKEIADEIQKWLNDL